MNTTAKQTSNKNPKRGFLLDTNLISEVCKKEPNEAVLNWLGQNGNRSLSLGCDYRRNAFRPIYDAKRKEASCTQTNDRFIA